MSTKTTIAIAVTGDKENPTTQLEVLARAVSLADPMTFPEGEKERDITIRCADAAATVSVRTELQQRPFP